MPWIALPDDTATPELERLTRPYRAEDRSVPGIIGVMKLRPKVLRSVLHMNNSVTFGSSGLGRKHEELLATVVSAFNDCFY